MPENNTRFLNFSKIKLKTYTINAHRHDNSFGIEAKKGRPYMNSDGKG